MESQTPEQNSSDSLSETPRGGRFNTLVKTLAVIGLVSILGLTGWGFVKVAQLAPGAFSNLAAGIVSITSQFFPADESDTATTTPETEPATTTDQTDDAEQNVQTDTGTVTPTAGTETREDANERQLRRITGSGTTGGADLAARIIEIGVIDPETENFTATSTFDRSDDVAVRFAVENVGSGVSKEWSFTAVLPTTPAHIYDSNTQRTLNPGDRIEYTIGFDRIGKEPKYFVVNIDPHGTLNDGNSVNNIARIEIAATDE